MATANRQKAVQGELIPRTPVSPSGNALEDIRRRLPGSWAGMSAVAVACDVSVSLVDDWRLQGLVQWMDLGCAERPYYRIYIPSLLDFLKTRIGGRP
jgi:hypothetical protein